jgi:Arc/MetJ-type ribon-helix-helix transcriptional regulator
MNVTLSPRLQKRIRELIERGEYRSADALVEQALDSFLDSEEAEDTRVVSEGHAPGTESRLLTGPEKARALREWAESHRPTPPLSDEAISRENIYGERG